MRIRHSIGGFWASVFAAGSMSATRILWALSPFLALLLSGCTTFIHSAAREMSDQQIATINVRREGVLVQSIWSDEGRILVYHRNRDDDADWIKLIPGTYVVEYAAIHRKIAPLYGKDPVELKAGHS